VWQRSSADPSTSIKAVISARIDSACALSIFMAVDPPCRDRVADRVAFLRQANSNNGLTP
jgi:hypothetical protein